MAAREGRIVANNETPSCITPLAIRIDQVEDENELPGGGASPLGPGRVLSGHPRRAAMFKHARLSVFAILAALAFLAVAARAAPPREIVDLINAERKKAGLQPLTVD